MVQVVRRFFGRLAVQVALGSMLVLLLVGVVAIMRLDDVLRENEERGVRSSLSRARDDLAIQLRAYQDFIELQAASVAQLDGVRTAMLAGDPEAVVRSVEAEIAAIASAAESATYVTLFDPDGAVIAGALAAGEARETPHAVTDAMSTGDAMGGLRVDPEWGALLTAATPIYAVSGEVLGALELAFAIDGGLISEYVSEVDNAIVLAIDGRTVVATDPDLFRDVVWPSGPDGPQGGTVDTPAGAYLVASHPVFDELGDPIGMFYVGVSRDVVDAGTAAARRDLLSATGIAGLGGMLLIFAIAWLTTRPMRGLVEGARRIQANDLESPVPVSGRGEVHELGAALEEMRIAIRQSRESMLSANRELASRVDLSTTNLAEATNELVTVHEVLARLEEAPTGDLSGVAGALANLDWVDGVVIALRNQAGRLSVAASTGLAPGATVDLVDVVHLRLSREPFEERWHVPISLEEPLAARLASRRIGGFAVYLMNTTDGVAGFAAATATLRLTMNRQRETVLRAVAREVALNLERRELEAEVEESRRISDSVLQGMSDGVLVLDHGNVCRVCNPAAARMLGYGPAELVGRESTEYLPVDHDVLDAMRARTAEFPDQATAPVVTEHNGRRLALTASLYPNAETGRDGMIMLLRDLSAEAEVERVRRDFVSVVGHELRTPLTLIRTSADLLHEGDAGELSETQARLVAVLRSNADSMSRLISDLVDMSALEPGRLEIRPTSFDIRDAVEDVVDACAADARERQHSLRIDAPPGVAVWADRTRIGQVLTNLVSNAMKYTPEGGTIEVAVRPDADTVAVSVADNGVGIRPEEQAQLFERFYRGSDGRRMSSGAGLGLPIARALVELHGGTLVCESDGVSGSTFTFTLPLEPVGST